MNINDLLKFDPLGEAERMTGKDYKNDEDTSALGFLLAMDHNERKANALRASGDSSFRISFENFVLLAVNKGFVEIYRGHFYDVGESWSSGREETYLVMWRDGVLLTLESYGESVNMAKMYYNLEVGQGTLDDNFYRPEGGGRWNREAYDEGRFIYVGNIDVREGFVFHLNELEAHGNFVSPWVEAPFLWLLNYTDTRDKDYNYEELNRKRIAQFPAEIREAINV